MTHESTQGPSVIFDRAADYYDRTRGYRPEVAKQAVALLARAGSLHAGSRVLEVGVGTGRIALPLAAHVHSVVGLDRSAAMLAQLATKRTTEAVHALIGDATALPFPNACFDAVVAVHFFHLLPAWRAALLEIKRVLAKGGQLILGADDRSFPELWDAAYAGLPRVAHVGVAHEDVNFPLQAGFRRVGEELEYRYVERVAPASLLRSLQERVWSATWRLSDEQHGRMVSAMHAAILERYGSLDAVVELERRFTARCFVAN